MPTSSTTSPKTASGPSRNRRSGSAPTVIDISAASVQRGAWEPKPSEGGTTNTDNTLSPEAAEDHYAERIRVAWSKTVQGILDAGQALIDAKAELHHGRFEHLVKERCPFGSRTAQRLMAIASNEVLTNPTHVSLLPASWGTLAELAKFEPRELKHALQNHWIKSDMPRKDVPALHRRVRIGLGLRNRVPRRREKEAPEKAATSTESGSTVDKNLGNGKADRWVGRSPVPNQNRILTMFADTLDALVPSCEMVVPEKADPDVLSECIGVMDEAMATLNQLLAELKQQEAANGA